MKKTSEQKLLENAIRLQERALVRTRKDKTLKLPKYKRTRADIRSKYLTKTFGITLVDYNAMFTAQQGRCAICEISRGEVTRDFAVDHNHQTGKIRALLCGKCNIGLEHFNDNSNLLSKARDYLQQH